MSIRRRIAILTADYIRRDGNRISFQLWYNARNKEIVKSSVDHIDLLSTQPDKFGVSKILAKKVRQSNKFEDIDILLAEANKQGWVRVYGHGDKRDLELNLQSVIAGDIWRTAKHFSELHPYTVLHFDLTGSMDMYTERGSKSITFSEDKLERYLKTGRIPK